MTEIFDNYAYNWLAVHLNCTEVRLFQNRLLYKHTLSGTLRNCACPHNRSTHGTICFKLMGSRLTYTEYAIGPFEHDTLPAPKDQLQLEWHHFRWNYPLIPFIRVNAVGLSKTSESLELSMPFLLTNGNRKSCDF